MMYTVHLINVTYYVTLNPVRGHVATKVFRWLHRSQAIYLDMDPKQLTSADTRALKYYRDRVHVPLYGTQREDQSRYVYYMHN